MEYIKSFTKGADVLSSDEIISAKSFEELVKEDYSKAYVFGLCIRELLEKNTLTKELEKDLSEVKEIPEKFTEATNEAVEVLKEYGEIMGRHVDPIPAANYILTVLDKHGYDKKILVLVSFFLGQATIVSEIK